MYDSKVVIPGIVIFVVLFTFPFWSAIGSASQPPEPDLKPAQAMAKALGKPETCVRDTAYMKRNHMWLLNQWRNLVVRDGDRVWVAQDADGQVVAEYKMSLTSECMKCHSNKKTFCDSCHNYMGVTPYCWDCHLEPKENK